MHRIHDSLFIGDLSTCRPGSEQLAVIHACKSPCHQRAVEYAGTLPRHHPHYLALVRPYDLYLNLIDPPVPLFQLESFHCFLAFASQQAAARPLLIHCNQGESRAPSLALLLLALQQQSIPDASYAEARAAFVSIYPAYKPGAGMQQFLAQHWKELAAPAHLSR
jgi:hypothetical protein